MLTFRIEFPPAAAESAVSRLRACANTCRLRPFKRHGEPGPSRSDNPDYIVFHPETGVFGALRLESSHLSFRVEHPVHLSCDVRVKEVFFAFARALQAKILESLSADPSGSLASAMNPLPLVSLEPDFPDSPTGLTFGEGIIWDEWSLARAGPEVWNDWINSLPTPTGSDRFRGRPSIFLELGFGSGDFLASQARSCPGNLFIGVESSAESIQYAAKRVRDLTNVRLIHGDAISFLRWLAPMRALNGIYIHFPYPWDKRRHRRRRMIRRDTLPFFENCLRDNGFLQVVTDSQDYARQIVRLLRGSSRWSSVSLKHAPPAMLQSRYLQKWIREGRRIFTIHSRRSRQPSSKNSDSPAYSRALISPLSGTLARFPLVSRALPPISNFSVQTGLRRMRLEGVYGAEDPQSLLLRLIAVLDDGIARRLYLLLRRGEDGYFSLEVPEGARFLALPDLPPLMMELVSCIQADSLGACAPQVFSRMLTAYGPQNWWPYDRSYHQQEGSDFRDEIAIGAILTQATTWRNVERALTRLKELRALSLSGVARLPRHLLQRCLEPARFPAVKAQRLLSFIEAFYRDFGGSWDTFKAKTPLATRREWLLRIPGIGEETADTLLAYALGDPVFVIDAYTRRLFQRMGYTPSRWRNKPVQDLIQGALGHSSEALAEFHALIVHHAKAVCLARVPRCEVCPIADFCVFGRSRLPPDKITTGWDNHGADATLPETRPF
jgi:endonuclease-3 related protein